MRFAWLLLGLVLILLILWEAFETVVFPRHVTRRIRLTRLLYWSSWQVYSGLVSVAIRSKRRETWLSFYGPLSLPLLLGIWACILIAGFGCLYWSYGPQAFHPADKMAGFLSTLYLSGTTFFTLGLGDIAPVAAAAKCVVVVEAGTGFAFLALVLSYLPALNQSFSRRETNISLLDARAGSPPTAAEMLRRHSQDPHEEDLRQLFQDWEQWCAQLLESHLSYPVLAYFRSQHDNQSWLAALTTVLDAGAIAITSLEGACVHQAELTFAIARHAVVDLSIIFRRPPREPKPDRLPPDQWAALRSALLESGLRLRDGAEADRKLLELRGLYEPYVFALARFFCLTLPTWTVQSHHADNWQTSPWKDQPKAGRLGVIGRRDQEHF